MSSLEEKMMKLTEEEKFKLINEIIGNDIKDEDNNINKIKNKNLRHLAYGVAAGAATMLLPKITRAFSEKTGAGEWAKEHIFGKTVQQEIPGAGKTVPESIADAEKPAAGRIPENNIPEKTIEKAETVLEVQKGSSLEGSFIQHLKGHPELIEKYNELNGGRSFNAGQIAHRMALDYADKYPESFPQGPPSLVHEGTGIRMNLETMEIEDIQSEEKIGYLPENDTDSKIRPEEMKTPSFEENQQEIKAGDADAEKVFDTDQGPRNKIIEDIGNKEEEINRIEEQPASRYSHNTNNPLQHADDIEKLKGSQRELWEKLMQEDTASEVARDIKKEIAISNPENCKRVKDLTFDQIRDADVSNDVKNNIAKVYRTYRTVFGKESMPKNEETVAKWTERLARLLIKNK